MSYQCQSYSILALQMRYQINDINEITGYGIIAKINNNEILIGNDKLLNINIIYNNSDNDKYFTKTNICFNKNM